MILALLQIAGCGPRTPADYEAFARDASPTALADQWRGAGDDRRHAMVAGLLAAGNGSAITFLIDRAIDEPNSPANLVTAIDKPTLASALVADLPDADEAKDGALLGLLGTCCQPDLIGVIGIRTAAVLALAKSPGANLGAANAGLARAVAHVDATAEKPALEGLAAQVVTGLTDPTVVNGGGCALVGVFAASPAPAVQTAFRAGLPRFAAECLAGGMETTPLLAFLNGADPIVSPTLHGRIAQVRDLAQAADAADAGVAVNDDSAAEAEIATSRSNLQQERSNLWARIRLGGAYQYSGWMVAELGENAYEVARLTYVDYLGEVPSSDHLLLRTTSTSFTTTGRFQLWVQPGASQTVTLQNGFVSQWSVIEEQADIPASMEQIAADAEALRSSEAALQEQRSRAAGARAEASRRHYALSEGIAALVRDFAGDSLPAEAPAAAADPVALAPTATASALAPAALRDQAPPAPHPQSVQQRAPDPAPAGPTLVHKASRSSVGLGESIVVAAQLTGGLAPCVVRVHYRLDEEWAARMMTDDHAGGLSATLMVKDGMGDSLAYYIDAQCQNGTTTDGTRKAPHSRKIL